MSRLPEVRQGNRWVMDARKWIVTFVKEHQVDEQELLKHFCLRCKVGRDKGIKYINDLFDWDILSLDEDNIVIVINELPESDVIRKEVKARKTRARVPKGVPK